MSKTDMNFDALTKGSNNLSSGFSASILCTVTLHSDNRKADYNACWLAQTLSNSKNEESLLV